MGLSCAVVDKENNFKFLFQQIIVPMSKFFKEIGSHPKFLIGFVVEGHFLTFLKTELLEITYDS